MSDVEVSQGESALGAAAAADASAARTEPVISTETVAAEDAEPAERAAAPSRVHVVVLADIPRAPLSLQRGSVVGSAAEVIATLPADAVRPATDAEVSIATPRIIILEE